MLEWKKRYPGVETLNVAVMGCIVSGPRESKHADIGISLPGTGETRAAPVFIDGKKSVTLRSLTVVVDFKQMVIDYIDRRFGHGGAGRTAAEWGLRPIHRRLGRAFLVALLLIDSRRFFIARAPLPWLSSQSNSWMDW
jgi:hypothetical protein